MSSLKIKNMVCDRCITSVQEVLEGLGYQVDSVSLGKADIKSEPDSDELDTIAERLDEKGFELIRKQEQVLIEQIKTHLINYLIHIENEENSQKLSAYLSEKMHRNYSYLSNRFSQNQNVTIEQFLIHLKIERVKELLSYDEMTLSEIAWKLGYSSVQYLSNQFKSVTGETVSSFRKHMDNEGRQSLDTIR